MTVKRRIAVFHKQPALLVLIGALVAAVLSAGAFIVGPNQTLRTELIYSYGLGITTVVLLLLIWRCFRGFTRMVREEIAQLERSEAELRLANLVLNAVFAASPVAIVALDPHFRVTMWNMAAQELLGWSQDEALGQELSALVGQAADDVCVMLRSSRLEEHVYDCELEVLTKTGEKAEVSLSGAVMRHADGEPWGYVAIMADLSERKRVQAALERQKSVEERDRLRSQLLAITAHELRNPMASIKGILSFMRWRISEGKPVRNIAQKLEVLEREADRLSAILDEMSDAFSIQEGQLQLKSDPVDVHHLLVSALQPFVEAHERRTFQLDGIHPESVTVLGDFRRLEDVFRNLLSNAVKYSPPTSEITVRVERREAEVHISVSDRGVGILAEDLPYVFDGFYRGNNLTDRDPGGIGLGLYICKGIVESHGGRISIESVPGAGTTCRVVLPVIDPTSGDAGTPGSNPPAFAVFDASESESSELGRAGASSRSSR